MDDRERYGKGLEVRRAVLGDAHVERRERFLAYVTQAQHSDQNMGPVQEIDACNRVRFWLEQLSSGKRVTRAAPRAVTGRAPARAPAR